MTKLRALFEAEISLLDRSTGGIGACERLIIGPE